MKKKNLSLKAHAKINLFLEALYEREDGFNEIRTIFSEIDVYDILNFVLTKNNAVKILTDTDSLRSKENLIYRTAVFIKEKYNVDAGVEIELIKNIPIAAGLGGGSSDAAQTIIGLNKLWELNMSQKEMHETASIFGSDINFFLQGGTAIGRGRGELIQTLDNYSIDNIFLVNPMIQISSGSAYKLVEYESDRYDWHEFWQKKDLTKAFNRLEAGVCQQYELIDNIIGFLKANGAINAILSGSGATIIGFCPDRNTAERFTQYYSRKGYWNSITKTKGEPNEHY